MDTKEAKSQIIGMLITYGDGLLVAAASLLVFGIILLYLWTGQAIIAAFDHATDIKVGGTIPVQFDLEKAKTLIQR
jgi:hypothetical protein